LLYRNFLMCVYHDRGHPDPSAILLSPILGRM
jgi:hypothetical protein